eukprot:CAMPEP_0170838128 /NCGR_PEP_ID=MMETSP0734-20130129/3206_1 /TAXON_ID=186038 /ORGANISM="Fragilariopsis kerguelensis, Strain L26-C5" /LENGTH=152 /DNA_ID=CAMNT_0011205503 /DNA_START=249 /DNA_END=707 /DNA_ORIENTATION=-
MSFVIRCLTRTAMKKLEDLCDINSGKGVNFFVKDKYHNHRIRKQINKLCVEVLPAANFVSVYTGNNDSDIEEIVEVVEEQYSASYDIEEVEVFDEEEEQSDDSFYVESPESSQSNTPTSTTIDTSPLSHPKPSTMVLATAYAVEEQDTFNDS